MFAISHDVYCDSDDFSLHFFSLKDRVNIENEFRNKALMRSNKKRKKFKICFIYLLKIFQLVGWLVVSLSPIVHLWALGL